MSMKNPEEVREVKQARKQRFWDFLSMVLSICYGLGIFVISAVFYAGDLVMKFSYHNTIGETWNLVLCLLGTLLLLFLIIDIHLYIRTVGKMHNGSEFVDGIRQDKYELKITMMF